MAWPWHGRTETHCFLTPAAGQPALQPFWRQPPISIRILHAQRARREADERRCRRILLLAAAAPAAPHRGPADGQWPVVHRSVCRLGAWRQQRARARAGDGVCGRRRCSTVLTIAFSPGSRAGRPERRWCPLWCLFLHPLRARHCLGGQRHALRRCVTEPSLTDFCSFHPRRPD